METKPKILFGQYVAPYVVAASYLNFQILVSALSIEIVKGWFNPFAVWGARWTQTNTKR